MKARLLALAAITLSVACDRTNAPTGLTAPTDPSKIISDGAHGGNKDFFFLPPMVPLPLNNPDFELGKFNNSLRASLKVEICQLNADHLKANGLPTEQTTCGAIKKTFAPGTVNLVNLPLRQNGWWSLFNLPPDGFYYVLWDTRQSNLSVSKYYRIKVLIAGSSVPLGVADVDPMSNLFQWKYSLTGEVIQLVDDVLLPIPFRVERGALCPAGSTCTSATVTNNSPAGFQTVTVDNGAGAIAGARFPNGWLPAGGPQSVVVTISSVNLGTTDPVTGLESNPCHPDLPLQQFPGCFTFSTTPELAPIDESGRTFATPVIGAVCFSLFGSGDPRANFVEMYASDVDEPAHAMEDASDAGILAPDRRNCSSGTEVIGADTRNSVTRFASSSWRKVKSGVGQLFGVKTAYAIDLGLGGFFNLFSNMGPALSATIQPVNNTHFDLVGGGIVHPLVRIIGSNHHDGHHQNSVGIAGLPVTWTVSGTGGTILGVGDEGDGVTQLTTPTNTLPIDPEFPTSGGGYSAVDWTVPSEPGDYTVTANGPAFGGPVTFSVTVTAPVNFSVLQGTWINDNAETGGNPSVSFSVDGSSVSVHAFGSCSPTDCDWGNTPADMSQFNDNQQVTAIWDQGFVIVTQTITLLSTSQLSIVNHYDFQPPDTRTDFTSPAETFTKQ